MITPRWTLEAFIRIIITVGSLRAKCTLARVIETEAPKRANGAVAEARICVSPTGTISTIWSSPSGRCTSLTQITYILPRRRLKAARLTVVTIRLVVSRGISTYFAILTLHRFRKRRIRARAACVAKRRSTPDRIPTRLASNARRPISDRSEATFGALRTVRCCGAAVSSRGTVIT
jgi:hypothetical protein